MRIAPAILLLAFISPAFAGEIPSPDDERAVDVLHFDVALNLDFDRKAIAAVTKIEFVVLHRTGELQFSGTGLSVDKVSLAGHALQFDNDGSRLTIHLARALDSGEHAALAVEYHGEPRRGLVFGRNLAYTNYWACEWMICAQDDFGDKASIRLALEFPKGSSSFGPGQLVSRTTLPDGRTR
ncbi:MAG: hypothetical protein ABI769_12900, partial [Pseudomonadota bacterium]